MPKKQMARTSTRPKLITTPDELADLTRISRSKTSPAREVKRAGLLLSYLEDHSFAEIARRHQVTRETVYSCVDKALASGVASALRDLPHGSNPIITAEARTWVLSIACSKPVDHGLAAELWTRSALATFAQERGPKAGHPTLANVSKSTIHFILTNGRVRPHKIKYYLERRDPDFEAAMREVLLTYQEVDGQIEARKKNPSLPPPSVVTVSVDEKPGVQALGLVAPDLPPVPGDHPEVGRDYEYKRMGTASILAGLDLLDGHIIARVERRHRSVEFVALLKDLDAHYPPGVTIRLILDNHSAHISKETRRYLESRPNRFKYVHTPKHGSWLNLVETLFGKMARTFLKGIRVKSWAELKERILKGIAEINAAPVVHRWKNFDALAAQD
jgi:transposase